jgi:hypothetical protein
MSETIILGTGADDATGYFFHAPAGTAIPEDPTAAIPAVWKRVGYVTQDGLNYSPDKSTQDLKDWANKPRRTILTDHNETLQVPIMETTEETMKVIFGSENVTVTDATTTAGKKISVNLSPASLPEPEAFLFLMKDGNTAAILGCSKGQITEIGDVTIAPSDSITWNATIKGLDDGWQLNIDDGTPIG